MAAAPQIPPVQTLVPQQEVLPLQEAPAFTQQAHVLPVELHVGLAAQLSTHANPLAKGWPREQDCTSAHMPPTHPYGEAQVRFASHESPSVLTRQAHVVPDELHT